MKGANHMDKIMIFALLEVILTYTIIPLSIIAIIIIIIKTSKQRKKLYNQKEVK